MIKEESLKEVPPRQIVSLDLRHVCNKWMWIPWIMYFVLIETLFEGILPHYWLKFHYGQLREYISIKIFNSKIQLITVENNKLNWPSILINLEQCTGSIWCQKRSNNCYRYISWIYAQWMKQNISNFLFHTKMYALQGASGT